MINFWTSALPECIYILLYAHKHDDGKSKSDVDDDEGKFNKTIVGVCVVSVYCGDTFRYSSHEEIDFPNRTVVYGYR